MNYNEVKTLGNRLKACKGWKPLPGTVFIGDDVLYFAWADVIDEAMVCTGEYVNSEYDLKVAIPDLRSPATLGILTYCVRLAYTTDDTVASFNGIAWTINLPSMCNLRFDTEPECLVTALENAVIPDISDDAAFIAAAQAYLDACANLPANSGEDGVIAAAKAYLAGKANLVTGSDKIDESN